MNAAALRERLSNPLPSTAILIGYTAGAVLALYPGMLPRSVSVQLATTAALGLVGGTIGSVIGRCTGRGREPSTKVCGATVRITVVALLGWILWQQILRESAAVERVSPIDFAGLAAATLGVPYAAALLRSPRLGRAGAVVMVGVAAAISPSTPVAHSGPNPSAAQRFLATPSSTPGIRVYAALADGANPEARARVAVDRLLSADGTRRRAVVIAMPTGSGWVDAHFVRGVESELRGDSAIVAVQYTQQPSWLSFLMHRAAAARTATAVVDELHRRDPAVPLLLYGQSLGVVGLVAASNRAAALGHKVLGTLQAGTPASVPVVGPSQLNASDPVGVWSPGLLVTPPERAPSGDGAKTARPPWLPIVGFVATTVDLLIATAMPSGLGHRYDETQGSDLVRPRGTDRPSATTETAQFR